MAFARHDPAAMKDFTSPKASLSEPPSTEEECLDKGGEWGGFAGGRGHIRGCNLPTSDAGKSCDHSDQCEGACLDQPDGKPTCSDYRQVRGCGIRVRKPADMFELDGELQIMCVD